MYKYLTIAALGLLLSGCGEKSDFENAINAKISKSKLCYSLQDNDFAFNKGFPIKVDHGYRSAGYSVSDEILKGLAKQGLLDVSQQSQGFSSVDVLEVTDKGQQVEFWDRKDGACVGHRAVDKITEWTESGNGNQKVVRVSYTWKLTDIPSWVDKSAFSDVKGMSGSADGAMNLVKTSNGWKAI
ncbi:DNA-directed RNA polymerase subunit beta [Pantoea sp. MT58]|uniref:DNA-directed RNA polymerase subunit beta n=1 Tax=Pantoea sp. MT58 TaxID=2768165 RepID=UPI00165AD334|nr:DNA-directed RNA polymerase subunit beta [Pantoea sp. MT58]QNQ60078.1 DNA-directed RNA polymerase subunit beta [Pantoea sp. MT58]